MKEELINNIIFQTGIDSITSVKSSELFKKTRLETILTLSQRLKIAESSNSH